LLLYTSSEVQIRGILSRYLATETNVQSIFLFIETSFHVISQVT
jgi:hypothetical protein